MQKPNPFPTIAMALGIGSILSFMTVVLPLPLGCLGLLFAALAHRKGRQPESRAIVGIVCSLFSVVVSLLVYAMVILSLPTMMKDPVYRQQLNDMSTNMTGMSFDEMMREGYGIDLDKYFPVE